MTPSVPFYISSFEVTRFGSFFALRLCMQHRVPRQSALLSAALPAPLPLGASGYMSSTKRMPDHFQSGSSVLAQEAYASTRAQRFPSLFSPYADIFESARVCRLLEQMFPSTFDASYHLPVSCRLISPAIVKK